MKLLAQRHAELQQCEFLGDEILQSSKQFQRISKRTKRKYKLKNVCFPCTCCCFWFSSWFCIKVIFIEFLIFWYIILYKFLLINNGGGLKIFCPIVLKKDPFEKMIFNSESRYVIFCFIILTNNRNIYQGMEILQEISLLICQMKLEEARKDIMML